MHLRIPVVSSSLLVLLFGYTATSKLLTLPVFETILGATPYISRGAAVLARLVPLSELGLVLLLLFPKTRLAGLYGSVVLLGLFTIYLVAMLLSGQHLPCSCGGVIGALGWWEHVGLNVGLLGLSVFAIRRYRY